MHFGELTDYLIGLLQQLSCFRDRHPGKSCRHVQQITFVERRHELRADFAEREECYAHDKKSSNDDPLIEPQNKINDGSINPNKESVNRVVVFRQNLTADPKPHKDRNHGDR